MKRQLRRRISTLFSSLPAFRHARIAVLLLMPAGAGSIPVLAAPVNDTCAGAETISGTGPFPYLTAITDISTATLIGDPPLPSVWSNHVSRSVWYKLTPATTANYRISTCAPGTTVADTVIALYEAPLNPCAGPFTRRAFGDKEFSCEAVRQLLTADTTYFVVVWKYFDGTPDDGLNNLQLVVERSFPPANDTCANAISVQLNFPVDGTTVGAFNDYEISGTGGFWGIDQTPSFGEGPDVAYSFVAPETGTYSFRVSKYDVSQLQNLVLYVASGPCPVGSSPAQFPNILGAANRSTASTAEEVFCLSLTNGQQVIAMVDGDDPDDPGGNFRFEVTRCLREQEPNNFPTNATLITCGIEGSTSPQFDLDFYALGRHPEGWRAFVLVDGEAAKITDFDLRITTATDTIEYDDKDNDGTFGDNSPNIAGARLTGEPAFVLVNYLGGAAREPYRIYAVLQPPIDHAVPESEPNDVTLQADSANENYFYGTLPGPAPSTDTDVYAFGVAEGDLIFLSLDGDPYRTNAPINAKLELLDGLGNPLEAVNDSNAASTGSTNIAVNNLAATSPSAPAESLVFRSSVEGTFFARVSSAAGAGNYLLSISKNCVIGSDGLNHPPVLTNINLASPVLAGIATTLTGTIWEIDLGDAPSLTVSWGDGTTNRIVYAAPGRLYFSAPHQFNTGNTNFTVTITAIDSHGGTATMSTNVHVGVPSEAARFTAINPLPSGQINLQLAGTPFGLYRIEKCNTLGAAWTELGTRTATANGTFTIDDPSPALTSRFYRAVTVP